MNATWCVPLLALSVPATFGAAALLVPVRGSLAWAARAAALALALALVCAGAAAASALGVADWPTEALRVRVDVPSAVMLALVGTLGFVVARYSRAYLAGDPGRRRYARWLLATLGAVTLLILSEDLVVVALAWTGASLSLHQLLAFYGDRPAALVASHKKFLLSRLADACTLGAVALVGTTVGSTRLGDLERFVRDQSALPTSLQLAALLFASAAALKSAQLPFHGWLVQVMEAPTPVSALLHAGVVNLGGFLMIRLSPLMARAAMAQALLVVVGTFTAVVAALVVGTRASVKVQLAWSTCAQMGFMLVQCGLGLWHLALLHLVAHSLYKAHAFLSAGSTVDRWRARSLAAGASWTVGVVARLGARLAVAAALYVAWHELAGRVFFVRDVAEGSALRWGVALAGLGALLALQAALALRPTGGLARALQPRLAAGLWLDELFTRATFRVWPPSLPPPPERAHGSQVTGMVEV